MEDNTDDTQLQPIVGEAVVEFIDGTKPAVPARVRTVAYFVTLGTSAVAGLTAALATIWAPDVAGQVAATGVAVTSFVGVIGGGLGVAYRPRS